MASARAGCYYYEVEILTPEIIGQIGWGTLKARRHCCRCVEGTRSCSTSLPDAALDAATTPSRGCVWRASLPVTDAGVLAAPGL